MAERAGRVARIKEGEIAISDSLGPRFAERWVPLSDAQSATYGNMNVIKW
jgi:hypothetical protein